jgi:CRP/FNR family cyclic AMP-dependent transcriptional regulator
MVQIALITALLGRTDLFRSLSEADRSAVAAQMHKATFESGQLIFGRGDAGEGLYLVVEGRVRLSVLSAEGRALSFGHAGRGDIFGEIATLDGQARTADATALTRVTTTMLTRSSVKRLMEARPQLAQAAVALLCRRLRATSEQTEAIALHSTQVRLARFLLAAISMKGQTDANSRSIVLDLGMSQTELGLLLGASRSKVNEALATLETLGAIHSTTGHIECDVGALRDIARDSPNDPDRLTWRACQHSTHNRTPLSGYELWAEPVRSDASQRVQRPSPLRTCRALK